MLCMYVYICPRTSNINKEKNMRSASVPWRDMLLLRPFLSTPQDGGRVVTEVQCHAVIPWFWWAVLLFSQVRNQAVAFNANWGSWMPISTLTVPSSECGCDGHTQHTMFWPWHICLYKCTYTYRTVTYVCGTYGPCVCFDWFRSQPQALHSSSVTISKLMWIVIYDDIWWSIRIAFAQVQLTLQSLVLGHLWVMLCKQRWSSAESAGSWQKSGFILDSLYDKWDVQVRCRT